MYLSCDRPYQVCYLLHKVYTEMSKPGFTFFKCIFALKRKLFITQALYFPSSFEIITSKNINFVVKIRKNIPGFRII